MSRGIAPALPRTNFNDSRLIRLLAGLGVAEVAESKQTLAERLAGWMDWTDAIALSAALGGLPAGPAAAARPGARGQAQAMADELDKVRADLTRAIAQDAAFAAGRPGAPRPLPAQAGPVADRADFSTYRRRYLAQQRAMEARIPPLRTRVRAALAAVSADLGRLAALDAALDAALGERERHLLSKVPRLLERRFEQLRQAHPEPAADDARPVNPSLKWLPPVWLATYCSDMQTILLAELAIRLNPVEGMIEALGQENLPPP